MLEPPILALALLIGPLLAGFLAGSGLRAWRGGGTRSAVTALVLFLACPVAAAALGPYIRMGIWDSALIGLLAGLGMLGGLFAWQRRPLEMLLAAASFGLALGAAECAVRKTVPPPPGYPAIEGASLFLPRIDLEHAEPARGDFVDFHRQAVDGCSLLYPENHPAHVAERTGRDREAVGSVVYLGDSMTYGLGVRMDQAFPAVLEQRTPSLFHFNLGFPGTSVDYHYMIARHWIDRISPPVKLVVLGLYFNDILEIGQGMPCCQNRSLLTFEDGAPAERCPAPSWVPGYGESMAWFLRNSPPPYPLRAAMSFSHMAQYLGALQTQRASRAVETSDRPTGGTEWRRMSEILAALRADLDRRRVSLVALLMPARAALEAREPATLDSYRHVERLKQLTASLGIRTVDPWPHFLPLVQRDGSSRYFLGTHDIHLTREGHVEMANYLAATADEIRAAATVAATDS